jgi:hypothetical protein
MVENMYPPPPPPDDESEGTSKTRVFIVVGVLIAVLAVGLFAAWMILQSGRDNPYSTPSPTPYITPQPTVAPEFSMELTTGSYSATIYPGDSTQATVFVKWQYGYAEEVNLSAEPGSSGIQCSFSAGSSRPDFSSVLTMTVPDYTTPGYYQIEIKGTNTAGISHSIYYGIQVL